jgi:hypothetical protein
MAEQDDDGVSAITTLLETLRPLKAETRANVLDYVFKTLGITLPGPSTPPPGTPSTPTPPIPPAFTTPPPGAIRDLLSLKEQKQPKTVNQMVAVMAYYLAELAGENERRDYIVADDIRKYFRQANFPLPSATPNMTLVNAKNAGYLDALSKGQYRLNPVGHNLVAHKLPRTGEAKASSSSRANGRRQKREPRRRGGVDGRQRMARAVQYVRTL